jgi:RimJ/RimL family protein N-acetyltransferase
MADVPTLSDGVVVLDAWTLADVAAQLAGEDDEQAWRFGWFPRRSTEETVRAAIERWREQWRSDGCTRAFATRDAVGGALVGGCELRLQENRVGHCSYWTFPAWRCRGYAARALRLLCEYAFAELAVVRVEAQIEADNVGSRGVVRAAGLIEQGVLCSRAAGWEGPRREIVVYARVAVGVQARSL